MEINNNMIENNPDWHNGIEFGKPRNGNSNVIKKRTKLDKLIEAKRKGSKKKVTLGGIEVSLDQAIDYYKRCGY